VLRDDIAKKALAVAAKKPIKTRADKNKREKRNRDKKEQKEKMNAPHDKAVLDGKRVTKKKPTEKAKHHNKQNGREAETANRLKQRAQQQQMRRPTKKKRQHRQGASN
jgi:hypothetical protein